jgi:hypothetical protein
MREMPPAFACERHGDDLFLRMHFLRKVRGGNEKRLPELRWGTGEPAKAKLSTESEIPRSDYQ